MDMEGFPFLFQHSFELIRAKSCMPSVLPSYRFLAAERLLVPVVDVNSNIVSSVASSLTGGGSWPYP